MQQVCGPNFTKFSMTSLEWTKMGILPYNYHCICQLNLCGVYWASPPFSCPHCYWMPPSIGAERNWQFRLFSKFIYSEKTTKLCEISTLLLSYLSKVRWRFCKILWPSQNIWILPHENPINKDFFFYYKYKSMLLEWVHLHKAKNGQLRTYFSF